MKSVDARGKLEEGIFDYRVSKNGKLFISWRGKEVMILKDQASKKILERLRNASEHDAQLILAKVTGNFKRGNEKKQKNLKR
ncbi:hypothetical protein [Fusibacter ferrireducens]|uniref:Uncharacterized protein n=1 Tax=Fusibacter ferrireducens TaxID=2785058 RepID=A0ABR9ZV56_9FIRM|nr:hypothetical protein [Fusibacter ferrireducens]MBF4694334.1 hypothetical protein [Fusibacter ferrireducens]